MQRFVQPEDDEVAHKSCCVAGVEFNLKRPVGQTHGDDGRVVDRLHWTTPILTLMRISLGDMSKEKLTEKVSLQYLPVYPVAPCPPGNPGAPVAPGAPGPAKPGAPGAPAGPVSQTEIDILSVPYLISVLKILHTL